MANTLMSLLVSITADTSELGKSLKSAEESVGGFSKNMQSVGSTMSKTGGAMTLGLTAPIAAFGTSAVKSAMDAESAVADLEAVLKSTGGAAGVTLDELIGNASALQKVTKFSDESVMSAQGMLLTFTNIGKDVFPMATEASLDMAEKFGMDASQAAITLGKALNDPIAGVGSLRRIGVQLTDEQERQIKTFMSVGDSASAQAIILRELETEIGGVAKSAGATSEGEFAQFMNMFDDMKEIVGSTLIPILARFIEAITPLIEKFAAASPQVQTFIIAGLGIVAALGPVIAIVGGLVTGIGAIIPVVTAVAGALAPFAVPILAVIAAIALLYLAWTNNFGGIQEKFAAFIAWIKPIWDALWAGIKIAFEFAWAQIKTLWEAFSLLFQGDFRGFGEKLREYWDRAWEAIKTVITTAGPKLLDAVKEIGEKIKNWFQNIDWGEVGKSMMKGLGNALLGALPFLLETSRKIGSAVMETVGGFFNLPAKTPKPKKPGTHDALGGPVFAGVPVTVGEHGIETFVPRTNGTIIPHGETMGGGKVQNITVNIQNPKREAAEDDVRRALKNLSYLGAAA